MLKQQSEAINKTESNKEQFITDINTSNKPRQIELNRKFSPDMSKKNISKLYLL